MAVENIGKKFTVTGMARKYLMNLNLNNIRCTYKLIMLFMHLKSYA